MTNKMDEELKSDLAQTLTDHHEALVETAMEDMDLVRNALAKTCHFHVFFTKGATVEVIGHLRLKLQFPKEGYYVETADILIDTKEDIDLAVECHHSPDWDSLDRTYAYPRVTCRQCGSVASLRGMDMKWITLAKENTDEQN